MSGKSTFISGSILIWNEVGIVDSYPSRDIINAMYEAYEAYADLCSKALESIKKHLENLIMDPESIIEDNNVKWEVPMKIVLHSQVNDRRPKVIRARCHC